MLSKEEAEKEGVKNPPKVCICVYMYKEGEGKGGLGGRLVKER